MKNIIRVCVTLSILVSIVTFTGCEKQILDQEPLGSFTEKDLWEGDDLNLIKTYVWNNYTVFGEYKGFGDFAIHNWTLSDNAYPIFYPAAKNVAQGNQNPEELGPLAEIWPVYYEYIRNVNIFLQRIDDVNGDTATKSRLTGDMKFIRAYCYSQLLDIFGGVPIITKPFELNDNFEVKRDSYQKGIEFVVNELNDVSTLVPENIPAEEWGRVTKGAALALKSQVLLYAASKLHDPTTTPNGPLYTYDKNDKWEEAAAAAKAVIDMGQYSLVKVDNSEEYQQMFLHKTTEIIFARPYSSEYSNGVSIDNILSPNGYSGWSGATPTQDLVDSFQMKDGKSIKDSPLYNSDPESIYQNKELRFYADIVYQGAYYRGRKTEFYLPGGLDSRDGPGSHNYAITGYTIRKHMDESVDFTSTHPETPNIFLRLAGIYLNYAEAEYHLGNEEISREYINKIRNRVHLPNITSSGPELLKDIQHERRIELCFEGFNSIGRWSDLRRWMLAEEILTSNRKGIEWEKINGQGNLDPNGKLSYNIINVLNGIFTHKMYYVPIPNSEIQKTNLIQNEGY